MGILDGTVYGGFTLATKPDGTVDDAAGAADPYACAIPFDQMPQALDPAQGYVFTANNDPGGLQVDGDVANDRWYLGADWDPVRADTIHRDLEREVTAHTADIAGMAAIQADSTSRLGELFTPDMLRAIDHARDLASLDRPLTEDEQRLVAPYQADAAAFDEVERRLQAWGMAGYDTPSGVETFYHHVAPGETDQAVATMIFNAWFPRVMQRIFDDEPIQGTWRFSGDHTKVTVLTRFLRGRGPGNTEHLASFNPDTNESVFFDDANTPPIESSDEEMLLALADGLAFLRSPPNGPGDGGFGTPDMNQWLWGLRHMTRFESLVAPYLNDPALQAITDQFSITTHTLPLADNLADDDPRKGLKWFPRPSDEWAVNAGNPGLGGTHFTHGNGPVMRMVIELKDGHVRGQNIIPGGQSGLADSPFFADQVRLWLAQEALPLRFHPEDVAAGATGRETFKPE
jgi:penicillin amidase